MTHGGMEDGESAGQGAEGSGGGARVLIVEPACLHKAALVAGVAAHQEQLIFYHRTGWAEGYCKKKVWGCGMS